MREDQEMLRILRAWFRRGRHVAPRKHAEVIIRPLQREPFNGNPGGSGW